MDVSDFLALVLSELYGCSVSLTTFLVNSYSLFHRPVLILQPTMNCITSDIQSMQCQHLISQLGKKGSYSVSKYIYIYIHTHTHIYIYIYRCSCRVLEVEGYILAAE